MTNNNQDQYDEAGLPIDPAEALIERIQFGEIKDAGLELKKFIGTAFEQNEAARKVQAERERSAKLLAAFEARNPDLAVDRRATDVIKGDLHHSQVDDLKRAGYAMDDWLKAGATTQQVADLHLQARAAGNVQCRTADVLLNDAVSKFEAWSGKSRTNIPDSSRTIRSRQDAARIKRGLPVLERAATESTDSDPNSPSNLTPETFTLGAMGQGTGEDALVAQTHRRMNAIERMQSQRRALKGPGGNLLGKATR